MAQRRQPMRKGLAGLYWLGALAVAWLALSMSVAVRNTLAAPTGEPMRIDRPSGDGTRARIKTTGYCECGDCCSWRRSWFGLGPPVVSAGPSRGRPKTVGMTASGTWVRPGVIAADTNLFPIGTIFHVPGYGWGRVEDTGGAIKGYHIDLYFRSHQAALNWGVRVRDVRFWRPEGFAPRNPRILSAQVDRSQGL